MRRVSAMIAAALLAAGCTSVEEGGPSGSPADCDPDLVSALGQWAEAGWAGAVAISGGGQECRAAFGSADGTAPNTDETVFAIGSVSKGFTAAAVLGLAHEGALSLDDTAGALLPGLSGPAADATVEQLLLHTSGLAGDHGDGDHRPLERDAAIADLSELESAFEPGSDFMYSNAGYTLLALIVDEVTGSYRDHMAAEVLTIGGERIGGFWDGEPAAPGPRAVGEVDGAPATENGGFAGPHWALDGNGDLAMTTGELAEWTRALFEGEVIDPAAVEVLESTRFDYGDGTAEIPGWVAVGAEVFGTPLVTASGGGGDTGHNAVAAWLPEQGVSIAVTSNTERINAGQLAELIVPAVAAGEPVPLPEPRIEADPEELAALEGVYTLDTGGTYTVTAAEDGLDVAAAGADAVAAMFASPDFAPEDVAAHEEAVLALLNGETAIGREELEAIEAELGAVEGVELAGTAGEDELRTYVELATASGPVLAWYALDEHGGVGALAIDADPPTFRLVPTGAGEYRRDLFGVEEGVRVVFEADLMTVAGPAGEAAAARD
ncbi:serine hydrolase domain-containing protein [Glycomyces terrestris]|uniref:Class A beta-lactamase-related serine hydrolase n=1 Tax=Glycomyces terrestris TaxID=2493553 RepID=A0A426V4K8_9ACTN|nr:serine hydrolase domain-containing protein [Glycomyces terrestris]RRS01771.1 class A beta-lactamase-related serine hydrolase [Glycomyces terrestris]